MDKDIVPELLKKIKDSFDRKTKESKIVKSEMLKLLAKEADHFDSNRFAEELGDILARVFKEELSEEILPDGKMHFNIAQRIVEYMFRNNYILIADYTKTVQEILNNKANISLKAVGSEFNKNRVKGIVNRLAESDKYSDIAWILDEPVVNFSMAVVDDVVRSNLEFHNESGLHPTVTRKAQYSCCDWCTSLEGEYEYEDVKSSGSDVFRRHRFCRCTVVYNPNNGAKKKTVHSAPIHKDLDEKRRRIEHSKALSKKRRVKNRP